METVRHFFNEEDWDRIETNVEYFSLDEDSKYYDNPKGEMDVLLYREETRTVKYVEVKTSRSHLKDAAEQVQRAEEHFNSYGFNFEWEIIYPDTL